MPQEKDDIIDFYLLINKVLTPFKLIAKHKFLVITYMVLALLLSVILKFTIPSVYAGTLIIKANDGNDKYYYSMLLDLAGLVSDKDYTGLAKELNANEEELESLKKISLLPINSGGRKDSLSSVIISLEMLTKDKFTDVQNGILKYLEKSDHYQKLKKMRTSNLESITTKIKSEMREMDSVKKIVISNIKPPQSTGNNGLVYNVPLDPLKSYEATMKLYKEQLVLEVQKAYLDSFELIKPCVVSQKPVWPKLKFLILFFAPIFLVISLVHASFKDKKAPNKT